MTTENTNSALPPTKTFEEVLQEQSKTPGSTIMNSGIPITLFSEYVEIEVDGVKKNIPYKGLKDIIDRSLNSTETISVIKGLILPSNVFFISQNDKELRMSCYYPGGNRNMIYSGNNGEKKMEIVAPNIIISFTLGAQGKDWIYKDAIYTCTDLPISKLPKTFINGPRNQDGIYLLPMSNTYDEGRMCFGGNVMPARFTEDNFRSLDWYYRFLWETPFNNDLGIRAVGRDVYVNDWYTLLAKLAKDGKTFPYRDLRGWREMEGAIPSTSELRR